MIIIALIINSIYIPLIPDTTIHTTDKDGYANIQAWDGGTIIYAHNYLSGGLFYELRSVSALYDNGDVVPMRIKNKVVYTSDWDKTLTDYSDPSTITLVTCYPQKGTSSWRLIIELEPDTTQETPWQKKPLHAPF